jgi:hypothetical protein
LQPRYNNIQQLEPKFYSTPQPLRQSHYLPPKCRAGLTQRQKVANYRPERSAKPLRMLHVTLNYTVMPISAHFKFL